MKILFICGSADRGHDGVADYTSLLAEALAAQGIMVRVLALHDSAILESTHCTDYPVEYLRLPATWPWSRRIPQAASWIAAFDPTWISVQFVVFGFHPRGLPFGLAQRITRLCAGRPTHLMMHEIAMGFNSQAPWRHRLYGQAQRWIIHDTVRRLGPALIHTTTPFYQTWLAAMGIRSALLPLHGNIPVAGTREQARHWLAARLGEPSAETYAAGFFGGFSPMFDPAKMTSWLKAHPRCGTGLILLTAGQMPVSATTIRNAITDVVGDETRMVSLGRLSVEEASRYLHALDEGVTTYPEELLGKSGAVAAMWAHGLGVTALGTLHQGSTQPEKPEPIRGPARTPTDTAKALLASFHARADPAGKDRG